MDCAKLQLMILLNKANVKQNYVKMLLVPYITQIKLVLNIKQDVYHMDMDVIMLIQDQLFVVLIKLKTLRFVQILVDQMEFVHLIQEAKIVELDIVLKELVKQIINAIILNQVVLLMVKFVYNRKVIVVNIK